MTTWLESVSIENFGLMRATELALEPGLTVITGESGAGKSLLLSAVDFALGARASSEQIGPFGDRTRVRLTFQVDPAAPFWEALEDFGCVPDSVLVVLREWTRDGRSVFRVQGVSVPGSAVREGLRGLVDVTGQHEHQRLLDADYARQVVDRRVPPAILETVAARYAAWQEAAEAAEHEAAQLGDPRYRENVRDDLEYLEALRPVAGEETALREQLARWASAAQIAEGVRTLLEALDGSAEAAGAADRLQQAVRAASGLARWVSGAAAWSAALEDAWERVRDIVREAYRVADGLDYRPEEYERVQERLDALARAARRFGVDPSSLPERWGAVKAEAARLDDAALTLNRLRQAALDAERAYRDAAAALREARREALATLVPAVEAVLHQLDLPYARLDMMRQEAKPGRLGDEQLEWMFTAHRSQPLRPLARVASGGELARVALAIRSVEADQSVLLLDEVDAGLGGRAARQVAALLADLARRQQVVVVSHQPTVAAAAAAHWRVVRHDREDGTEIEVERLAPAERVHELARMLAGTDDEAARRHAARLLQQHRGGGEPVGDA